jgi:hypothetical protein
MGRSILAGSQSRFSQLFIRSIVNMMAMARKARYNIPIPTWTCPHCGFVHRPADLLRLNATDLECRQCGRAFPAVLEAQPEGNHRAKIKTRS